VTCSGCQAGPGKTCGDCDNTRSTVYPGAPETCNERDDDCDGQTDEGNPGGGAACTTGQQGVCGAGTRTCVDGALACVRNQAPSTEVCTGGLDEDCDGEVDAADTNCTPNCADADGDHFAVCGTGCQPPAGTTCGDCDDTRPGVHPGVTETCNERDDDCDSQADEGNPGGGAACNTGQQGVCGAGTRTCVTGALACVRNQAPSAEVCTGGLDEDCDGQGDQTDPDCLPDCVDQDDDGYVACGSSCQVPQGKTCGECDDARPEVHPGATEVCNIRDDDCDGQNNEGNPGSGEACLTGQLGLCSAGTLACLGTGLVCQPSVTPVPELCSGGLDEDCDGFTDAADSDCTPLCPDADNDLYAVCSAACRLPGGRQCGECDDGRQAVHPGALESCNNRDDDCDSQTDEGDPGGGFQCSTGEDGACDAGTRHCRSGQLVCERNGDPQAEACTNGEDDDCDGTQDGADPDCFPFCPDQDTDGYAICAVTCRLASGDQCGDCDDTRSSVNPGRMELCNGRDDDCDTQTDEGDPGGGGACSTGEDGICGAGTRHCTASGLSCLRNVGPLPESCHNGLDDDCDGEADDGDPNCAPTCVDQDGDDFFACVSGCQVPQGATCGDCDDDRPSVHPGAPETCNGRDDDCQGGSDEGDPGGNATCETGDSGNCAAGRTSCQHGDLICVALHAPGPEVCGNAVDEDCDGQSDAQDQDCVPFCGDGDGDGFALCGAGCRLALGDVCGDCDDASPNVHPGVGERCNDVDDDCDAQTDEGDPGGGPACETGELGVCVEGHLVCREGALACDPTMSPSTEVCASGGDEDCDGFTNTRDPDCILACQGVQGIDVDLDGVPNCADNCPQTPNRPQDDFDEDATGDACETGAVAADIDRSGRVDGLDLARLARAFGYQCAEANYTPASDFDHNCICDGDDLARMAAVFGRNP
jgi:hypothetical protein